MSYPIIYYPLHTHVYKRLGVDWMFAMMPYGPEWRSRRRLFHQYFGPNAVIEYREVQRQCVRRLLGQGLEASGTLSEGAIQRLVCKDPMNVVV